MRSHSAFLFSAISVSALLLMLAAAQANSGSACTVVCGDKYITAFDSSGQGKEFVMSDNYTCRRVAISFCTLAGCNQKVHYSSSEESGPVPCYVPPTAGDNPNPPTTFPGTKTVAMPALPSIRPPCPMDAGDGCDEVKQLQHGGQHKWTYQPNSPSTPNPGPPVVVMTPSPIR